MRGALAVSSPARLPGALPVRYRAQTAQLLEPSEGPFHDPPPWQDEEVVRMLLLDPRQRCPAQYAHSARSASMGSIRSARRAGTYDATSAIATTSSVMATNVTGSAGFTP